MFSVPSGMRKCFICNNGTQGQEAWKAQLGNLKETKKASPYVSNKYQQTEICITRSVQNVTIHDVVGIGESTRGKRYSREYFLVYATLKATKFQYRLKEIYVQRKTKNPVEEYIFCTWDHYLKLYLWDCWLSQLVSWLQWFKWRYCSQIHCFGGSLHGMNPGENMTQALVAIDQIWVIEDIKRRHERGMDKEEKMKIQGEDKQLHSQDEYGPEV